MPSIVLDDLDNVKADITKEMLIQTIPELSSEDQDHSSAMVNAKAHNEFSAANFFFVSTRLAMKYPQFPESKLISRFSSIVPRHAYKTVHTFQRKGRLQRTSQMAYKTTSSLTWAIFLTFMVLLTKLPDEVTGACVEAIVALIVGGLFLALYAVQEEPALLSLIVIGILIAYFLFWLRAKYLSHKRQNKIKKTAQDQLSLLLSHHDV